MLCGIGYIISPQLISFVYGQEFTPAVVLFQIALVYAYARGFMYILVTALNAIDCPGVNTAINWALVPLSISAFLIGSKFSGLTYCLKYFLSLKAIFSMFSKAVG